MGLRKGVSYLIYMHPLSYRCVSFPISVFHKFNPHFYAIWAYGAQSGPANIAALKDNAIECRLFIPNIVCELDPVRSLLCYGEFFPFLR